jgi:hypothetical protein
MIEMEQNRARVQASQPSRRRRRNQGNRARLPGMSIEITTEIVPVEPSKQTPEVVAPHLDKV